MTSPAPATTPPAEPSPPSISTYHCICSQLVLASTTPLLALPTRSTDKTSILTLPSDLSATAPDYATLHNPALDPKPIVIRREDGFEKRFLVRCPRCRLTIGYQLDRSQYEGAGAEAGRRGDVVYLLPGGLMETGDMVEGKSMEEEIGRVAAVGA